MMSNKYLRPVYSKLTLNKLDKLSEHLQTSLGSSDFVTFEQYLEEAVKILTTFYKDLYAPIGDQHKVHSGMLPSSDKYNSLFSDIKNNLNVLFSEFENLEQLLVANFNYAITGSNRLNYRLKKVFSLLGDYILYNDYGSNVSLIHDSFNNVEKIEINSNLLNSRQCYINQSEGVVLLPIDLEKEKRINITASPKIKKYTGAAYGNNHETGTEWHGDISSLVDSNADTWFEYEKVVDPEEDSGDPLIMDLTLNIGDPSIINFIRINPNNFGTRVSVQVESIETSVDGKVFTSIKDDIPVAEYLGESLDNVFKLSPSTSKYAGQGLYTFTPRKAKYVHIVMSQSDPYVIETTSGSKLRYAIGLRDIEIRALPFLTEGEIVSKTFNTSKPITKISIEAAQYPNEDSELATIQHFVSVDEGASWHELRPQSSQGLALVTNEIPEILNFNNSDESSVSTNEPVTSVRWKARLTRNDEAFKDGQNSLFTDIGIYSEIHDVPRAAPHRITLQNSPVDNSVTVIDPLFGSRGIPSLEYRLSSKSSENEYFLPPEWKNIDPPVKKVSVLSSGNNTIYKTVRSSDSEWVKVYVGNQLWSPKTLGDDFSDFTDYDVESEVYGLDWYDGILYFGDGNQYGKNPNDQRVALRFEAERIHPVDGANVPVKLDFTASPNKELVTIKRLDAEKRGASAVSKGSTVLRLQNENITSIITSIPGTQKTFVNGQDEFSADNQWSLDSRRGYIYMSSPNTTLVSVDYKYIPKTELANSDWDWGNKEELRDSIVIKQSGWQTQKNTYTISDPSIIPSGYNYSINLPHQSIVKKSLRITSSGLTDPFDAEVVFVDGQSELTNVLPTEEVIPTLTNDITGYASFVLLDSITTDTNYGVLFDIDAESYFTNEVSSTGEISDNGDYYIDRSSSTVYVKVSGTVESPGKIGYFYLKPELTTNIYSVDYENGIIYTQQPIDSLNSIEVSYDYSHYEISYPMARRIPESSYTIDRQNKTLTIDSSEILSENKISKGTATKYQVTYNYIKRNRENISQLKGFFSPVLRDYVLKLLPVEF
ncbi:hypothetical protein GF373_17420 [bacterium]|nr:hypothetical protein [bacterium]